MIGCALMLVLSFCSCCSVLSVKHGSSCACNFTSNRILFVFPLNFPVGRPTPPPPSSSIVVSPPRACHLVREVVHVCDVMVCMCMRCVCARVCARVCVCVVWMMCNHENLSSREARKNAGVDDCTTRGQGSGVEASRQVTERRRGGRRSAFRVSSDGGRWRLESTATTTLPLSLSTPIPYYSVFM